MHAWLAQRSPDVLALQEVRAPDQALEAALAGAGGPAWHSVREESALPGEQVSRCIPGRRRKRSGSGWTCALPPARSP
jgi:exodeoxyribonuclease III